VTIEPAAKTAGWLRLGALLCRRRRAAHIPMRDLARAIGYTFAEISQVENGHAAPIDLPTLRAWCAAVHTDPLEALEALGDYAPW
jgi:transcriptional regulator with XRE-family HTH domain